MGLDGRGVTLDSGERLSAEAVIDCRDALPSEHLEGGWQVFLGQHLRTSAPHGVERPVIMDAAVEQPGAYRFVYLLPLGPDEIFVEDTYYSDSPIVDAPKLRRRIADYCGKNGWQTEVVHEETGVLPVITGGDFAAYRASLASPESRFPVRGALRPPPHQLYFAHCGRERAGDCRSGRRKHRRAAGFHRTARPCALETHRLLSPAGKDAVRSGTTGGTISGVRALLSSAGTTYFTLLCRPLHSARQIAHPYRKAACTCRSSNQGAAWQGRALVQG